VEKQVGQQPEQLRMVTVFLGVVGGEIRKLGAFLENVGRFWKNVGLFLKNLRRFFA
jgi:hypothetical protein